jgi:3,4-dihydroxy 2-butanone 4-phosphate synthase/GTP cyclohydrolase II
MSPLASIPEIIAEVRRGRPVLMVDDEGRENEGDFVVAAEHATPEVINLMIREGRGLVCLALTAERARALGLEPMVAQNTDPNGTAFTVSVDHRSCGTGISAFDRAATIRACLDPATRPSDLRRPGHLFPLVAREGGVLRRAGHTEAAVDLARLAGLEPAGVICEVVAEDGHMARLPQLLELAGRLGLKVGTICDLIAHRRRSEAFVRREAQTLLPTPYGPFRLLGFLDTLGGGEHLAMVMGEVDDGKPVLVRVHSECLTGDVLHSLRCDCGAQLDAALRAIATEGRGVLVYLRQEGRGIGLLNKLRAYALQDRGADTVEANERLGFAADLRDYGVGAQILLELGVRCLRLLSNNPRKVEGLAAFGLEVVETMPLLAGHNPHNRRYLEAKRLRLGHWLEFRAAEGVAAEGLP